MELIPTVISAGYAAGLNAYGTVALLGLLGRAGFGEVPDALTSDSVIVAASAMYAIEFVTDKVPYIDNAWDMLHTLIRPAIGSVIGVEFADLDGAIGVQEAFAGGGAGATALTSHVIKTGVRLGVNSSPEPFSNIFISLAEDGVVAVVVALALKEPLIALGLVAVLIALGIGLLLLLRKAIRVALRKLSDRRASRTGRSPLGSELTPGRPRLRSRKRPR